MKQVFKSVESRNLLAYFLLAIAIIISYKLIQQVDVLFYFLSRFMGIISPFISGFVLAYILNIPCVGIQKLLMKTNSPWLCKKRKLLGILLTYLLLLLVVILVLRLVIPSVISSINLFSSNYQSYVNSMYSIIDYINTFEFIKMDFSMDTIYAAIQNFSLEKLPQSLNMIVSLSSALFSGFLALISSVYILFEKENFKKYLLRTLNAFFPRSFMDVTLKYTRILNNNFKQYIYTQTIDGCILGSVATLELVLLGSPYALILGIMLGIVNYIPYFGSIFGSIFVVVIVAFTQNLQIAGLTAVILLITQQIDGNIIQPKLMGGSFSLSPLLIIISITIGGKFYGIFGMLAAIPIVAVIKNITDEIVLYNERKNIMSDGFHGYDEYTPLRYDTKERDADSHDTNGT